MSPVIDYKKILDNEIKDGHVAFHEFALNIDSEALHVRFFFFEGDEDPSFYMPQISHRLHGLEGRQFICNGREQVLKAHEMVQRDGRGSGRSLFFVDKDHTDFFGNDDACGKASIFQTRFYSIENYLVSDDVFRCYWVQRLHLSEYDPRLPVYRDRAKAIMESFYKRSLILMGVVLVGRGALGGAPVALNLNNVQLDRIFKVDWVNGHCGFNCGAFRHFIKSSNISNSINISGIKTVVRNMLIQRDVKIYLRGKYELWMFWKIIRQFTQELGKKDDVARHGLKRATPSFDLSLNACVESFSPLLKCPPELNEFLNVNLI